MIHSVRRGATRAAAAAALVALIAGCGGSGLYSYPLKDVRQVTYGTSTKVGGMLVRNAFVLGPRPDKTIQQGGHASLYLWLFNRKHRHDRLVGATAGQAARSVTISGGSIPVPPSRLVSVGTSGRHVILKGLAHPLSGGERVRITLQFAHAGKVTFNAPVITRTGSYATLTPAPVGTPPVTLTPGGSLSPTTSP
ncbi:MAG: copper chaperone PCu(A)C [Streptosporangiaceae bacterium]